jgi:hypothetical protein
MTTTNKLVRLEDVIHIVSNYPYPVSIWSWITKEMLSLPTYPEPTKWTNHALLQGYIDNEDEQTSWYTIEILKEIQSRLTEGTEYKIDSLYEFSSDDSKWESWYLLDFRYRQQDWEELMRSANHIRPISISSEELHAIELLKKSWYTVTK